MTHTFREARYLTRAVTSRAAEAASEFRPCTRFVRRGSYRWPSLARWISPTASTGELPLPAACVALVSSHSLGQSEWPAPRASSVAVSAAVRTGNSSDRIESIADAHLFTSTRCRAEPGAAAAALQSCAPSWFARNSGTMLWVACVECRPLGRLRLARALHHLRSLLRRDQPIGIECK
jgi:hypothetical protein